MNRIKAIQAVEEWVRLHTHPNAYFHQLEYFQYCQKIGHELSQDEGLNAEEIEVLMLSIGYQVASYANNPAQPDMFLSGWCQQHLQEIQIGLSTQAQILQLLNTSVVSSANDAHSQMQAIFLDTLEAYYAADQYFFWMHALQREYAAAHSLVIPKIKAIYQQQLTVLSQHQFRTSSAQARFNEPKAAHLAEIRLLLQL